MLGEWSSVSTSAFQKLGRELVQRSVRQCRDFVDAVLSAEGQQNAPQWVPVGLVDGVGREASGAAVGKVVLDEGFQSRSGCRRDDLEVGQRSLLELKPSQRVCS